MLQGAGNYRDKTVILSGAEHPLGRLLTRALAAEGATVVAIGRRARPLERLARRDPQRIEPLAIALDDRAMQRVLRDAWGDTPVHAAIDLSPLLEAPSLTLKHRLAAATGLIDALRAGLVAGAGCHVLAIPRPGKNREAMAARAAYATVVAHMRAGLHRRGHSAWNSLPSKGIIPRRSASHAAILFWLSAIRFCGGLPAGRSSDAGATPHNAAMSRGKPKGWIESMATAETAGIDPVLGFALVGALGVGSQWLAWRLRLPAIVLMLAAGLIVGPFLGILSPSDDFGAILQPMVAIAVAIILFEGGLTLDFDKLRDAAIGVRRLIFLGAPLGWAASTAALYYVAGLSLEASAVFGGIMIVTGPTVIAPLLRQARLRRKPAALLQWEAIVNDPVGALAAVLAFEVVIVLQTATGVGDAVQALASGITVATILGLAGGWGISRAFRMAFVPEYMKVPVLFVTLLAVFALSDYVLHESGLLAVTIMGIYIANADLPSYTEMRRFKEHATVLLVSGVFILLAANMTLPTLMTLDWTAFWFVLVVILLARPVPVLMSLAFSDVTWRERLLVAFTGPRGVVLVAVAGLFGERLVEIGIQDADRIAPLAFALVAATVVLHGFTLSPMSRLLGLNATSVPGVLIVGGSRWSTALATALKKLDLPVIVADPNHAHLRSAREAGIDTFFGDILSEAAEDRVELVRYEQIIAATDNDAYNTLVATDLAPEFGRDNVFQLRRSRGDSARHTLPSTLGGRAIGANETFFEANARLAEGWEFRVTKLSKEFTLADWRECHPEGIAVADFDQSGAARFLGPDDAPREAEGIRLLALLPKRSERREAESA